MDAHLNELVRYLATQSWQIAVLAAVVAATTFVLRHRSAHIRYLLWLIVVAKCLVPPLHLVSLQVLPSIPTGSGLPSMPSLPQPSDEPPGFAPLTSPSAFGPIPQGYPFPPQAPQVQGYRLSACAWLAVLWIAGATVYLMLNLLRALRGHYWLCKIRRPLSPDMQMDAANFLQAYGVRYLPRIWIMEGVSQPFVWGLLRGSIYVPPSVFDSQSPEHRRNILAHELSHVLRLDAAVNALQVISQGLFWFHPMVWWTNSQIRQEREKCCDETVLARLHTTPREYSTTIVETLAHTEEPAQPVPSLAVASPLKHIEERIRTMLRPGKRFYKYPSIAAGVLVALVALLVIPTAVVLTTEPVHLISGTVRIAPSTPSILASESKLFDRNAYAVFMNTQAVMLANDAQILSMVVDDLAPRGLAFLSPAKKSNVKERKSQSPESILRRAVAEGIIKVAMIPDTELLEVTMRSENEEEAKIVVNSFLRNCASAYAINENRETIERMYALNSQRRQLSMRIANTRSQIRAATEADPAKTTNSSIQDQHPELKLDEELYEKVSRRLQEMDIEQDNRSRVQVATMAQVKGIADSRERWTFIILGATVALSLILLIVRHAAKPQP